MTMGDNVENLYIMYAWVSKLDMPLTKYMISLKFSVLIGIMATVITTALHITMSLREMQFK